MLVNHGQPFCGSMMQPPQKQLVSEPQEKLRQKPNPGYSGPTVSRCRFQVRKFRYLAELNPKKFL